MKNKNLKPWGRGRGEAAIAMALNSFFYSILLGPSDKGGHKRPLGRGLMYVNMYICMYIFTYIFMSGRYKYDKEKATVTLYVVCVLRNFEFTKQYLSVKWAIVGVLPHPHSQNMISSLWPYCTVLYMCVCVLHALYSCSTVLMIWTCVLPFVIYVGFVWNTLLLLQPSEYSLHLSHTIINAPPLCVFNFILFLEFRRMIDIGKKITFYFLQNVWKCTVFLAYAFKVCKKCYYDPKIVFLEKY
jgi:hypothetical protein